MRVVLHWFQEAWMSGFIQQVNLTTGPLMEPSFTDSSSITFVLNLLQKLETLAILTKLFLHGRAVQCDVVGSKSGVVVQRGGPRRIDSTAATPPTRIAAILRH